MSQGGIEAQRIKELQLMANILAKMDELNAKCTNVSLRLNQLLGKPHAETSNTILFPKETRRDHHKIKALHEQGKAEFLLEKENFNGIIFEYRNYQPNGEEVDEQNGSLQPSTIECEEDDQVEQLEGNKADEKNHKPALGLHQVFQEPMPIKQKVDESEKQLVEIKEENEKANLFVEKDKSERDKTTNEVNLLNLPMFYLVHKESYFSNFELHDPFLSLFQEPLQVFNDILLEGMPSDFSHLQGSKQQINFTPSAAKSNRAIEHISFLMRIMDCAFRILFDKIIIDCFVNLLIQNKCLKIIIVLRKVCLCVVLKFYICFCTNKSVIASLAVSFTRIIIDKSKLDISNLSLLIFDEGADSRTNPFEREGMIQFSAMQWNKSCSCIKPKLKETILQAQEVSNARH